VLLGDMNVVSIGDVGDAVMSRPGEVLQVPDGWMGAVF
jgi:hypothetical protein